MFWSNGAYILEKKLRAHILSLCLWSLCPTQLQKRFDSKIRSTHSSGIIKVYFICRSFNYFPNIVLCIISFFFNMGQWIRAYYYHSMDEEIKAQGLVISLRSYNKNILESELGTKFPISVLISSPPTFLLRTAYTLYSVIQNNTLLNRIDKPLTYM